MAEHSKLPPSSAARRMACPGSRRMEELYPHKSSPASEEGTRAHEEAARCLLSGENSINPDVQLYLDFVRKIQKSHPKHATYVEQKLDLSFINKESFGTVDCMIMVPNENINYFIDFKYGFTPVEAFENWQLISYAACAHSLPSKMVLCIVQPRDFKNPVKTWNTSVSSLMPYWEKLQINEELSLTEHAPLVPSDQCKYCSARMRCSTLNETLTERIKRMDDTTDNLGKDLKELHFTQTLLEARITALEEEALARLKMGQRVDFYTLGRTQPREKWVKPIEEVLILGDMFEVNLKKPAEAITPKQAIKAGVPADLVREYSETPLGELKLEQIKESETKQIFGGK